MPSTVWIISTWSSDNSIESKAITVHGIDYKLSTIPNPLSEKLSFKLSGTKSEKPLASNTKAPKSVQITIEIRIFNSKRKLRQKISYRVGDYTFDTLIPISDINGKYNGRNISITFSAEPDFTSSRPPSKADKNSNSRLNNNSNLNSLSTVSSPTRHQSVKNIGRQSNASTSSTSSAAHNYIPQNSVSINSQRPKVVQPDVKCKKDLKSKGQTPSNNAINKPKMPPTSSSKGQTPSSSRKPTNASPAASIAASKVPTNPTLNQNNLPAPISEPKSTPNSTSASPSATIASKNSNNPQKAALPHITSPSSSLSSKNAATTAKTESDSGLPPIHNPRYNSPQTVTNSPQTPTTTETTPPNPSPHPPDHIDIIKEDPYAGLSNQGATCYMNSVLQSLFHIPLFRRSVFELPTENETDKEKSIALNLQALFCSLLLAPQEQQAEQNKQNEAKSDGQNLARSYISRYVKPVSTKNLTKSFGWNSSEALQQQDIQEFFRVLLNKLDDKIDERNKKNKENQENNNKKVQKENEEVKHVSDIFKGQTIFTISGEKVDFKSERYEDFYDLSLSVKGCSTLENSFLQFTKKEQLSDSYDTGKEKIAVQIQAQIFKLPKVLTLHLQRFEYDFVYDSLTKIYDELKFKKKLDMSPFLHDLSPFKKGDKNRSEFTLTGVLIHSGDASFGHYYVFLRPKLSFNDDGSLDEEKSSFYEFNDSSVHRVKDEDAIDDNFGGFDTFYDSTDPAYQSTYSNTYKRHSAYMLIYARNDCLREIFDTGYEIPSYIKEYSKSCQRSSKSGKKIISFFTEDAIKMNTEDGKLGIYNDRAVSTVKISSDSSYEQLYKEIADVLNVNVSNLRLWKLDYMKEIDKVVPDSGNLSTVLPKTVFVQYKPDTETTEVSKDQILLAIKLYTQENQCPLLYAMSILFSKSSKIKELKKLIGDRFQLPSDAEIRLFEELPFQRYSSKSLIEELADDESTLFMSNKSLRSGSSIIVQTSILPRDDIIDQIYYTFKPQNPEDDRTFSEALSYVDFMVPRLPENVEDYIDMKRNVRRMKLLDYQRSSNSSCIRLRNDFASEIESYDNQRELCDFGLIEFPYSIDLNQLIDFVVGIIPIQFDRTVFKLVLFRHSSRLNGPSPYPLKNISELTSKTQCLYVLLLPIQTPIDSRDKMTINIVISEDSFNSNGGLFFYAPAKLIVSDIVDGFRWIKIRGRKSKPQIRALQVKNSKILKVLSGNETVDNFLDSVLRIEFVPELNNDSNGAFKEVNVCNAVISGSAKSTFDFLGFPFLLRIGVDEPVEETRKKIAKNLKWSSEKMNHVRIYVGTENDPFDLEKVLKKGQKILDSLDVENGQRLILVHSSEDSFRDDYSSRTNGVQIY